MHARVIVYVMDQRKVTYGATIIMLMILWYTAREDYANSTSQVFNVTIPAGSTSALFSIDIVNDTIQESNETFDITIKLFSSCLSISLGNSSARVTIIDDDGMMILKQNISYYLIISVIATIILATNDKIPTSKLSLANSLTR